jgi:Xaa-Pro aminopeptidase
MTLLRFLSLAAVAVLPHAARAQISANEYQQRRAALASRIGDGVLIALGSEEPEQDYMSFYQNSPFYYLTGVKEPSAALIMVKRGGQVTTTLFVEPRDPAREVWSGKRMGPAGATQITGLPARESETLRAAIDSAILPSDTVLYVVGNVRPGRTVLSPEDQFINTIRANRTALTVVPLDTAVSRIRARKSPAELDLIRKAVLITIDAHREAMRAMTPGMNEFEIQALIEYTFRRNGADRPSFATIIGSAENSTTLHYNTNDRFMNDGDVVVMDIGASYRGYSADVTRTIPVNGIFSPAQRDIYQAVRDAQAAAERQVKLGALAKPVVDSANASLNASLAKLGLIEAPGATYDCGPDLKRQCPQLGLFYMHGLGHGIGLDVHDPGTSGGMPGNFAAGDAFTIEPGVYVRANVLDVIPDSPRNRQLKQKISTAVAKYRNIGVRIEDDYIVTEQGVEWVSRAPREIAEIEKLMKEHASPKRDAEKVNWYKSTSAKE